MKPKFHRFVLSLFTTLSLSAVAAPSLFAGEGGHSGNGGGLIQRNGELLTFGSAGNKIQLPLVELLEADLPELNILEQKLARISLIPDTRYSMVKATRMSTSRRYFRVNLMTVTPEALEKILAEYRKALKAAPGDQIVLAAITQGSDTYLFDAYFGLQKTNSKLAILAHEAFWILQPEAEYGDVINAEIRFEKCLEQVDETAPQEMVYCSDWIDSLSKIVRDPALQVRTAAYDDYSQGRLTPILDAQGRLPLGFFFPKGFFDLTLSGYYQSSAEKIQSQIYETLSQREREYPNVRMIGYFKRLAPSLNLYGVEWFVSKTKPVHKLKRKGRFNRTLRSVELNKAGFKPWEPVNSERYLTAGDSSRWEWKNAVSWRLKRDLKWSHSVGLGFVK